jgi:hypothetical protein
LLAQYVFNKPFETQCYYDSPGLFYVGYPVFGLIELLITGVVLGGTGFLFYIIGGHCIRCWKEKYNEAHNEIEQQQVSDV